MTSPIFNQINSIADFLQYSQTQLKLRLDLSWLDIAEKLEAGTRTSIKKIFAGEKPISKKSLRKLCDLVGLTSVESDFIETLHRIDSVTNPDESVVLHRKLQNMRELLGFDSGFAELKSDQMEVLSRWYHLHVLHAVEVHGELASCSQLLKAFHGQISQAQLTESLSLLERLGLVKKAGVDGYQKSGSDLALSDNLPRPFVRAFHRQMIERAVFALEKAPHETRFVTGTTFTIDKKDFAVIEKEITDFCQRLLKSYSKKTADTVVQMNTQIFQSAHKTTNDG